MNLLHTESAQETKEQKHKYHKIECTQKHASTSFYISFLLVFMPNKNATLWVNLIPSNRLKKLHNVLGFRFSKIHTNPDNPESYYSNRTILLQSVFAFHIQNVSKLNQESEQKQ